MAAVSAEGKPFSQACENNKAPILAELRRVFARRRQLLEVGSGSGQHAVYMAPRLPHLIWQTADLPENHPGINAWIDAYPAPNLRRPLALDVAKQPWPSLSVDAIFSANTCHILSWPNVKNLFAGIGRWLQPGGVLAIYGPFNYAGKFTSPSNEKFDAWLKRQQPHQGIRDVEKVQALAEGQGLWLVEDNPMPANNRLLVWRRR